MDDAAVAMLLVASVVGVIAALITVRRRDRRWPVTSIQRFGFAAVAALAALTVRAHSSVLDLVLVAGALTLLGFSAYAWHVEAGWPHASR